jgi:predicted unusual protein kinase regulating ubiquinone biosynthesis (AarF/ABC1/UbiB family)
MARKDGRLPGRIERTVRTAWAGGRLGQGLLVDRLRGFVGREPAEERFLTEAKRLTRTLAELRGPVMKIGQWVSTHRALFPTDFADALAPLQQQAAPMSFPVVREVVERELDAPLGQLFESFSPEPIAAASLGQVHRAQAKTGELLAVKVQYPGADATVDGDLRNVESVIKLLKVTLKDVGGNGRMDLTPFAEELREHLTQETDYCREAYNAKLFARLFAGHPRIVVPRVHDAYSGLRVVSYDFVEGEPIERALEREAHRGESELGRTLLDALWFQILRGGVLHADPHPGNFRVLPDGRIVLLDYGCVKVFRDAFLVEFARMSRARLEHDADALRQAMLNLGLVEDPHSASEVEDVTRVAAFFSTGIERDEAIDFASFRYAAEFRELALHFAKRRRPPPAHRDFLFLSRVVLGYFEYLSQARARVNVRQVAEPYVRGGYRGRVMPFWEYAS